MSKVIHMVALTQEDIEIIFGSLATVQELSVTGLMACQRANDVQGAINARDSLKAIQQVLQKLEPRIQAQDKQVLEIELEKVRTQLNNFYDPRREY